MKSSKLVAAFAGVIVVFLVATVVLFKIGNPLQTPMESVPFDGGWLGFVFIFANGFFVSYVLQPKRAGILERLLLTVGLGFGLTFLVMVLLGLFWEFTLLSVLLTQVILLAVFASAAARRGFKVKLDAFKWPSASGFQWTQLKVVYAICIAVFAVLISLAIYDTVTLPPTDWDSLAYGVNYAKIMFEKSTIPLIAGPSIGIEMSASYPPGIQLAAVFLYVFAGTANDFYYRILSPLFGLATLALTYKFANLLNKNRMVSLYAVAALGAITVFWNLFVIESYLMALAFMMTLSAFFFYKAYASGQSDARKYEVIAVLFCGFASLVSYIGLFSFGFLLLYVIHKRLGAKNILALMGLGVAIAAPWYLRNLVFARKPNLPILRHRQIPQSTA